MATLDTLTLYFFDMNSLAIIPLLKLCHFQSLSSPREDGNNAFQSSYNWSISEEWGWGYLFACFVWRKYICIKISVKFKQNQKSITVPQNVWHQLKWFPPRKNTFNLIQFSPGESSIFNFKKLRSYTTGWKE